MNLRVGGRRLRRARPRPQFVPLDHNPLLEFVPNHPEVLGLRRRRSTAASSDQVVGTMSSPSGAGQSLTTRERSRSRDRLGESDD